MMPAFCPAMPARSLPRKCSWSCAIGVITVAGEIVDGDAGPGPAGGDRIAVYASNHPESFITLLAASRIGAILVPLNWRLSAAELSWQMADAAPALLIHGPYFTEMATKLATQSACPHIALGGELDAATDGHHLTEADGAGRPDAELMIVYTSGTTGRPEGAVLAQPAMIANAVMSHDAYAMTPDDVVLNILPLFHVGGLNIQPLPALLLGAHVVIAPAFDPATTLALIETHAVTQVTVVPTVLAALLARETWPAANLDLSLIHI